MKMRSIILGLGTRNQNVEAERLPAGYRQVRQVRQEMKDEESLAQLHKETVLLSLNSYLQN